MMLITDGLWVAATGIVALSLECVGAALVFFGHRRAVDPARVGSANRHGRHEPKLGPLSGPEIPKLF